MKTHDLAKPFQCSTCNRGYVTAAALTAHMQGHKAQNQLAKRLKHFAKYQANCLPGLVPVDLIKSIMNCSQQIQHQTVSPQNHLTNLNGLNNGLIAINSLIPNNTTSFLPVSSTSNLNSNQLASNLTQPSIINPSSLASNPVLNNNLLQNNQLINNNNININLNNQLNVNLIQSNLKENLHSVIDQQQQLINKQLFNDKHLNSTKTTTINSSTIINSTSISSSNKRSIVDDQNEQQQHKRMRTSSISEKDENSCSSSFNSINDQSLDDEEEVDVTSFEEEERSNSVNSLISNSLSSSANSSNSGERNGDSKSNKLDINLIKKQSTSKSQKKYSCKFCNSNFDYKRSCDRHEKSIHTGERRFQCPECPNRYSR